MVFRSGGGPGASPAAVGSGMCPPPAPLPRVRRGAAVGPGGETERPLTPQLARAGGPLLGGVFLQYPLSCSFGVQGLWHLHREVGTQGGDPPYWAPEPHNRGSVSGLCRPVRGRFLCLPGRGVSAIAPTPLSIFSGDNRGTAALSEAGRPAPGVRVPCLVRLVAPGRARPCPDQDLRQRLLLRAGPWASPAAWNLGWGLVTSSVFLGLREEGKAMRS